MNSSTDIRVLVSDLLEAAGVHGPIRALSLFRSGGNNRLYRVDADESRFVVKQYFRHAGDSRDRLAAEYSFLTHAVAAAPGTVPRPSACNPEAGIALYEFVDGRALRPEEIGWSHVEAAIAFYRALNRPSARRAAVSLGTAADACFSMVQHLEQVDTRIRCLLDMPQERDVDREAHSLVRSLDQSWKTLRRELVDGAAGLAADPAVAIDEHQRCLSPSDFGFHNALEGPDGVLRFLDFEYAGWDDPAKLAGDFFAQVAVPVPQEYFNRFVHEIMEGLPQGEALIQRAVLLRPVYRVKWCCIVLNVFLPVHLARRQFADSDLDATALKRARLTKAAELLHTV